MKHFNILMSLLILTAPLIADEAVKTVTIGDFDRTSQGFSFSKGKLVAVEAEAEGLPLEIDFVLDMPHGLGMNNQDLTEWFTGRALIFDLGEVPLNNKLKIPEEGFVPFLNPSEIITGHTYLIRTSEGSRYGRIKILDFDGENSQITFNWIRGGK